MRYLVHTKDIFSRYMHVMPKLCLLFWPHSLHRSLCRALALKAPALLR